MKLQSKKFQVQDWIGQENHETMWTHAKFKDELFIHLTRIKESKQIQFS